MGEGSLTTSTFSGNYSSLRSVYGEAIVVGNIFAGAGDEVPQLRATDAPFEDGGGSVFTTSAQLEGYLLAPSESTVFDADAADIFLTGELADNGGATETLALNPTGPAIGVVPAGAPLTDQRGVPRPSPADAGAFQVEVPAPVPIPIDSVEPALAETGADTSPFIALGLSLFAGAAALFSVGRRQARRSTIRS